MKSILSITLLAGLFLLNACGNGLSPEAEKAIQDSIDKAKGRSMYVSMIDSAEKMLRSDKNFDKNKALAAMKAYNDFAVTYPKDSMTAEYLFRASDLAQGTGNYEQATIFLEQIISKYKGYPKYVDACFVCAFVYDSHLENVNHGADRARELYQFVADKYPQSPYASQALVLKKYIGMPDSVMLNDIMEKGGK
jgi:hypothetical protein